MSRAAGYGRPAKKVPQDFAAICGLYWEGSAWYEALDATCATQEEADFGKICRIYTCAREHNVAHCGLCPEFPCILLVHFAAQTGTEDLRIASAALRADVGDELWMEWAREQKPWINAFCPLLSAYGRRP